MPLSVPDIEQQHLKVEVTENLVKRIALKLSWPIADHRKEDDKTSMEFLSFAGTCMAKSGRG